MTTRYPQYQALIQQRLSPKRYKHSLNVMERAVYLARIIGADPGKAELAGLLHDVEKNTDSKILLQNLENSDILFSDADRMLPQLWHAPAGMLFLTPFAIIPPGGRICPRWKKRCIWRI